MPQKYTNIKSLEHIIMQMREEGRTRKEIADVLGIKKVQIKNWINRYNRRQIELSTFPKRKGRPRKNPMNEERAMALRIKELGLVCKIEKSRTI